LIINGVFKRGGSPSFKIFPPLLTTARGIKGVRLINNLRALPLDG
jgi:hypothetical protein